MRWPARISLAVALLLAASPARSRACETPRCLDIELVVVDAGDGSARDRAWLDAQLRHANALFSVIDVGFRVAARRVVAGRDHLRTRADRDELGRFASNDRAITVFLVRKLDDVDTAGQSLRGVHWRLRRDRRKTWIILSALDDTGAVLAHELGHYFGLPHSRARQSVMNKGRHNDPPFVERVFTQAEAEALRAGIRARFPELAKPTSR